jgi:hypothetical protein
VRPEGSRRTETDPSAEASASVRLRGRGRFGGMRSRPNACGGMPARRAKEVSTQHELNMF